MTSTGVWDAGGEARLREGSDEIRVDVFESGDFAPVPPRARVQISGIFEEVLTDEGVRVPGRLQVLNWKAVTFWERNSGRAARRRREGNDGSGGRRIFGDQSDFDPDNGGRNQSAFSRTGKATASPFRSVVLSRLLPRNIRGGGAGFNLGRVCGTLRLAWSPIRSNAERCQIDGVTGPAGLRPWWWQTESPGLAR